MKKLFKIIKIKFALVSLLATLPAMAKSPLAVITNVKGNVFVTSSSGRTMPAQKGQHLYDLSELTTTLGSEVSLNNYFDHKFHLSGAGNIKFLNKVVELRRGYLWVQALGRNNRNHAIQTANAQLILSQGEGVFSFDPSKDKSQFLSFKGGFTFGNLLDAQLNVQVRSGEFSYVDLKYREGVPRKPTPVGQESFSKVVGLFDQVRPLDGTREGSPYEFVAQAEKNTKMASRRPASATTSEVDQGRIRYIPLKDTEQLSKSRQSLIDSYDKPVKKASPKKKATTARLKNSGVELNVYGAQKPANKPDTKRSPASEKTSSAVEKIIERARKPASVPAPKQSDVFEQSLLNEYKKQKRHDPEVNQLIDELKMYEQDYEKGY